MGIIGPPLYSNDHSSATRLKLVAASGLPASPPSVSKSDPLHTPKKTLSDNSARLSDVALMEISKLKARDAQLRQHEQAHLAASSGVDVSKASFTYQRGPNGVNYAVAGDVTIDTSPGRTPVDTLARAEMIRDVALAPADPSATDRRVAVRAQQMAQQAHIELQQQGSNAGIRQADRQTDVNHAGDGNSPAPKRIDTFA